MLLQNTYIVTQCLPTSLLKGSNMIVCVLLVSKSRGCCLAAPGDHEGAARVIAPRWDNTTMIYLCFSRSVCFSMGSPAWWRFGLCSSGSSLVSQWRDDPLIREFQMWCHKCKQRDPHWFQGCQMRFWWMLSTISCKLLMINKVRLFSTTNI